MIQAWLVLKDGIGAEYKCSMWARILALDDATHEVKIKLGGQGSEIENGCKERVLNWTRYRDPRI